MADLIAVLSRLEGSDRVILIDALTGLWPKRSVGQQAKTRLNHGRDAIKRIANRGAESQEDRWVRGVTAGWEHYDLPSLEDESELADFIRDSLSRLKPAIDVTHSDEYSSTALLSYAAVAAGVDTRQTPFALCRDVKAAYDARIAAEDASAKGSESVDTVQRAHARLVKHKTRLADERLTFLVWLAVTRKGSEFRVPEDIAWPSSREGGDERRMQVQTQGDVRAAVDEAKQAHAHLDHASEYARDRFSEMNASAEVAQYWKHIKEHGPAELAAKEARARECRNMLPGLEGEEGSARRLFESASAAHQDAQQRLQHARLSFDSAVSSAEQERDQWTQQTRTAKDEAQRLDYAIRNAQRDVDDYKYRIQQSETGDPELENRLGVAEETLASLRGEYGAADESGRSAAGNAERAQQRVAQAKSDRDKGLPPLEQAAARTKQDSDAAERTFQDAKQRHQQIRDEVEGLEKGIPGLKRDIELAPVEEPKAASKAAADRASYSAAAALASTALDAAKTATEAMRRQRFSQLQDLKEQARQMATWWIEEVQTILPAQVRLDDSLADMLFDLPSASLRALEETLRELTSSKNPLALACAGAELPGHAVGVRLQVPALHSARHQLADMCQERESWTEVYERARAPRETELKWVQLLLPIGWAVEADGADPVLSIGVAAVKPVAQSRAVWAKAPKAAAQPAQPIGPATAQPSGVGVATVVPETNKPKNKGLRIVLIVVAALLIVPCMLSQFVSCLSDSGVLVPQGVTDYSMDTPEGVSDEASDPAGSGDAEVASAPGGEPVETDPAIAAFRSWIEGTGQDLLGGVVTADASQSLPAPTLSVPGYEAMAQEEDVLYVSPRMSPIAGGDDWTPLETTLLNKIDWSLRDTWTVTVTPSSLDPLEVSYTMQGLGQDGAPVTYSGKVIAVYQGTYAYEGSSQLLTYVLMTMTEY